MSIWMGVYIGILLITLDEFIMRARLSLEDCAVIVAVAVAGIVLWSRP